MATGTAIVDFGAFPGSLHATTVITGQTGIVADSKVEVWINPIDSVDHSADEHKVEPLRATHSTIVADTGFTAEMFYTGEHPVIDTQFRRGPTPNANHPRCYGKCNVMWAWT